MMWSYILKLIVLLPLVCGLMIGCLYLWRRLESRMPGKPANRMIAVRETMMISPSLRLAVRRVRGQATCSSRSGAAASTLVDRERKMSGTRFTVRTPPR